MNPGANHVTGPHFLKLFGLFYYTSIGRKFLFKKYIVPATVIFCFIFSGIAISSMNAMAIAGEPAIDHADAGSMSQECEEHGDAHRGMSGSHCCVSASVSLPAIQNDSWTSSIVGAHLAWPANQVSRSGPVFGIFRPPRFA